MEFILKILIVLLVVGIAAIVAYFVDVNKGKRVCKMSFREAIDLTGLPVITFRQGNNKFNFILDTGAYASVIDSRVLDKLQYTSLEGEAVGYGIDGKERHMNIIKIALTYKDKSYSDTFRVLDMSAPFDTFKNDCGVEVHGLLSSSFFEKYKYILDYSEMVAYSLT